MMNRSTLICRRKTSLTHPTSCPQLVSTLPSFISYISHLLSPDHLHRRIPRHPIHARRHMIPLASTRALRTSPFLHCRTYLMSTTPSHLLLLHHRLLLTRFLLRLDRLP